MFKLANILWYTYKRNNWLIDPRFYRDSYEKSTIDRPIFLVGNQGGGLTLISRVLRRHPSLLLTSNAQKKYLDDIDQEHIELIEKYCGKYAQQFNHQKPHS